MSDSTNSTEGLHNMGAFLFQLSIRNERMSGMILSVNLASGVDAYGHNVLHRACIKGDVAAARAALENGIDVDARVGDSECLYSGLTALHIVGFHIQEYKEEVSLALIRLLLAHETSLLEISPIKKSDVDHWPGSTAFHMAMYSTLRRKHYPGMPAIELLLSHFPEGMQSANKSGDTPCHILYGSPFLSFIRRFLREDDFPRIKRENQYEEVTANGSGLSSAQSKQAYRSFLKNILCHSNLYAINEKRQTVLDVVFGNIPSGRRLESMTLKYQVLYHHINEHHTVFRESIQKKLKEYATKTGLCKDTNGIILDYMIAEDIGNCAKQHQPYDAAWSLFRSFIRKSRAEEAVAVETKEAKETKEISGVSEQKDSNRSAPTS